MYNVNGEFFPYIMVSQILAEFRPERATYKTLHI